VRFAAYAKARLGRELSVRSLGPNEARILYDAAVAVIALGGSVVFLIAFVPGTLSFDGRHLWLLSLPALTLVLNAVFGIYSRLKTATGRHKASLLLASVVCAATAGALLSGIPGATVLWGLLAYGPMALARLLLNLPYSKHYKLAAIAVNHRGPVVVIGGAGYIGSHVVDLLLREGKRVRVLDRLMYGREPIADFIGNRNFELVEGDATDITKLTIVMKDASAVVHLAGLVGDPACAVDVDFTRHTNIVATRMAKDVAQSIGIHRFVFASSCSVYGVSDKEVSETGPVNPVSLYAQTKIDSERELLYSGRDDFFVTVLRFATVFGHSRRPRFDLVGNLFTAQAMADALITVIGPQQWRPFIHVRDLARSVVMVLNTDATVVQGQVFNVGDKRLNLTILQLAEAVQSVTRKYRDVSITVSENIQDRRNYAVSFEKIHSLLGFEAATLIPEGIEEMAANFLAGKYQNYREEIYSNVAMTAKALNQFQDPMQGAHLYTPLTLYAKNNP
jgi:nucleoside-diphosphate-sugar epimerase